MEISWNFVSPEKWEPWLLDAWNLFGLLRAVLLFRLFTEWTAYNVDNAVGRCAECSGDSPWTDRGLDQSWAVGGGSQDVWQVCGQALQTFRYKQAWQGCF